MTKSKNKRINKKKRTIRGGKFRFFGSSKSQLEKDWVDEDCEKNLNEKAALIKQKGVFNKYLFNPRKINSCVKIANKLGKSFDARGVQASSSTPQYFEDAKNKKKLDQFKKEELISNADFKKEYNAIINEQDAENYVREKFRTKYDTKYNKDKMNDFRNKFEKTADADTEFEYNPESDDNIWNDSDETHVDVKESGVGLETGGKKTTRKRRKRRNKDKNKKSRKPKY